MTRRLLDRAVVPSVIACLAVMSMSCRRGGEGPSASTTTGPPLSASAVDAVPVSPSPTTPPSSPVPVPTTVAVDAPGVATAPGPVERWFVGIGYAGFSDDGLLAVAVEDNLAAGVPVAVFLSVTTGTIEKTLAIDSDASRRRLAEELRDEGFPPSDGRPALPRLLTLRREGDRLVAALAGREAGVTSLSPLIEAERGAPVSVWGSPRVVAVDRSGSAVLVEIPVVSRGGHADGSLWTLVRLFDAGSRPPAAGPTP